jgi:hypothetical protein
VALSRNPDIDKYQVEDVESAPAAPGPEPNLTRPPPSPSWPSTPTSLTGEFDGVEEGYSRHFPRMPGPNNYM